LYCGVSSFILTCRLERLSRLK